MQSRTARLCTASDCCGNDVAETLLAFADELQLLVPSSQRRVLFSHAVELSTSSSTMGGGVKLGNEIYSLLSARTRDLTWGWPVQALRTVSITAHHTPEESAFRVLCSFRTRCCCAAGRGLLVEFPPPG